MLGKPTINDFVALRGQRKIVCLTAYSASIAKSSKVLTIGIGASAACDGQILVTDDMVGLYDAFTPEFVRKFTNLQYEISGALECYCAAVIDSSFPAKDHLFFQKKF